MRTRSQAYLPTPPTSSPPQPTKSRKRSRASNAAAELSSPLSKDAGHISPVSDAFPSSGAASPAQTPRKTKRVRFSEPGPSDRDALGISSTSLTPSFRKARLISNDPYQPRRHTLPARLEYSSSSPPPPGEEVQFAPLRQVLDNRLRRRLHRNHLSETVNAIEQEQRDELKARREVELLRASGQHNEDTIKQLMFELESQRLFNIAVDDEDEAERLALKEELQRLKFELLHQQDAQPIRERLPIGAPTEIASNVDDQALPSSPTRTSSPFDAGHFNDFDGGEAPSSPPGLMEVQSSPTRSATVHTGCQTGLPDLIAERHISALSSLQSQLQRATRETSDAKGALRSLKLGLSELGFAAAHAPPEDHVAAIRDTFRSSRMDLERLLPGETPAGFENAPLLPALLNHVRILQRQMQDRDSAYDQLATEHSSLRSNFNMTVAKTDEVENRLTVALARRQEAENEVRRKDKLIEDLEIASEARAGFITERDATIDKLRAELASSEEDGMRARAAEAEAEHQRTSITRLQCALESYRDEVSSLEILIQTLEAEKQALDEEALSTKRDVEALAGQHGASERRNSELLTAVDEMRRHFEQFIAQVREQRARSAEEVEGECVAAESFLQQVGGAS